MSLYLTAIIKAKPAFQEEVGALLSSLVEKTTQEEACIRYEMYQDNKDNNTYIFQELWKNQEGLDHHYQQPYMKAFLAIFDKLQEEPILYIS